jgi:hypothetical protein
MAVMAEWLDGSAISHVGKPGAKIQFSGLKELAKLIQRLRVVGSLEQLLLFHWILI